MPNPDNIKLLYNELKDSYDIESEDAFREYLSDANNREALRKELEADYDVGDSASFATYLGFGNEPSKPQAQTTIQPAEGQAPSDAVRAEYADTIMSDGEIVPGEKMETTQPDGAYNERMRGYQAGAEIGAKAASTTVANAKKNAPKEQPLQTAEPTQVQPQAQKETPQAPQSAQETQTNYEPSGTPWLKENEPKPWENTPWNTRNVGDNKAVNEEWKAARQEQTATTQQLISGTSSADAWKQNATAMRRMDAAEYERRVRGEEFDNTDNNFETFYQSSVAPTFKTERARADEEGTKAAAQYPSMTASNGMTVPNVMAAAAYEKATDPAVVTQNVLANLDGNALSQYVERRMHVDEQPMMGGIERQLTEEELNLVRDLIAAENGDVVTKLQQRMYQDYINEGGNMTTAGYILGNGFRNSLLMRLQDAIVTRIAGSSGLRKQFLDMAYQRAGERAGAIARGVSGAVTMIADAPAFGVAGKVAAPIAKGLIGTVGKAIAGRAAGELSAAAAERFIVANSRLGRVAENMLQSGLTFSGYDVMSEGVNQFQQGQFDAGELVNRAIKGFGTGAAIGVLGGATGELTKELTGVARGVGKAYGFAAEVGLFTGMQGLEMAAELGIPITDVDWGALTIENAAMLGVLKLQSMPFRARMAKDVDLALNNYDIEELRKRGYDFGTVTEGLNSLKSINSGGEVNYTDKSGKPYSAGEQRKVNAMYAKLLADKDIPIDVKRKVRFYLEGEFTPYEPVFGMSEVQMGNGGTATFETYSADGSVISREHFANVAEAEGRRAELMDQVAVNQLSAYMKLAEHPLSNIHKMANMEAKGNAERERLWDIIDRASRGEELTQEEADTYLELYNNAADYGIRTSSEIFNGVAKNVKGRTGIDVQSLLADKTRKAVDWTPEEREAVHTYLDEIGRTLEFRGAFAEMQLRGSQEGAKVRIEGVPEEPIDEGITPQDGGGVPHETVEQAGAEYNDALSRLLALDGGTEMRNRIDGLLNVENSIDEEFVSEFIGSYGALGEELYNACMDYAKAEAKRRAVESKAQQAADDIQKEYGETFEPAVNEDGRLTMGVYDGQSVVIKNWDNESDLVKILDAGQNETTVRKADIENINLGMPFDEWVRMNTAGRVQTIFNNVNIAYQPQESVGGGLGMPQGVNGEGGAKPAEDGGPTDFPDGEIPPTGDNPPTPPTEPENIAPTEPTQPRTEGGMPLYEEGGKMKPDFKNATSEETYNYLYGERKMNRDDINAFVRNKVSDAEKRLKKLEGKRPKMGTDLDEFEDKVSQWEKDKTDTQKELDYWNDVQRRAKQENLDEQRENADLAAQWKKVAALDDAVSLHEYLMRQVYGGLKFIWENNENGTKGLGAHLGLGDGAEKRSRRWMIGKQENGAMYPEKAAEVLAERYSADTGNDVEYDEVFNTLLDILRGYDRKSVLGNDILKEHNAGQFNEDTFNKEDEKRSKDAWAVEHGFEDYAAYEDYMKSLEGTERPEGEDNGNPPVLTDELETQEPQAKEEPATPTEPAAEPQGTVEETPKVEQPTEPKEEKKEEPSISKEGWNGYKVGDTFDWQFDDGTKEKVQIVAFDRSNSQDGTPEIVLRHYDEQGNLTGTEAYPPLAFDEEVKRQKALQKPAEPKGTFNPIEEAKKNVEEKEKKGTGKTSANGEKKEEKKKDEPKSKWVNDEDIDEFEEIRRKLREKLNQLNSGFDPEALQLSIRMAYLLMKHGVRKFADFAKQVIDAIGDGVRPHLKSIYAAAYYDPRFKEFRSEMTPLSEMEAFDVDNFDKKPKEEKALTDEWHYYVTWDKSTGRVTLYRESRDAVPVGDGRFHISAKNAEELRGILKNNGMEAILNEADVHNPLVASELHDYEKTDENNGVKGGENAGNDVSLQKSDKAKREAFTNAVASDLEEALLWGDDKPYKSIVDVRKRARELGMKVDEDGRTDILLQELVENGLVRAARKVVTDLRAKNLSRKEIYDTICQLYNLQPTITLRSSNRIKMQQYSTPLPMSFVAQMFIDAGEHTEGEIGLEPTAGNGMLVFATPAESLHVNELDETRLENLQGQGFKQVTNQDATKPFEGGRKYDFVIMNPPFGSSEAKNYDGKKISGLDPQITLNALESMKDNGRAAIIIGGNMEYGDNGAIKGNKAFFTYLYDHYNVKGIVDMDGSLYRKQGTTYPTRMILIDGRRSEEERAQTTVYPPVQSKAIPVVKNEQELYDTVEGLINSKEKTNGTEVLQGQNWKSLFDADYSQGSVEQGGRTEQPGKNDSPKPQGQRTETEPKGNSGSSQSVSGGQSGPNNGNGKLESGNTGASGNGGSRGNTGNDNRGLGAVGTSNRGNGLSNQKKKEDRPNSDNRLSYRPHNTAFSLESVAPAAMVESMDKAVTEVEQKHGNIDEFVTKELGYDSIEEMHNALAAEQVDSVAMAIHQMMQGQALVIGDQTGVGKGRQMAALIRWAVKQGKKPIFFTQKADLFTDIYRDLVDIGSGDLKPFIFNSDGAIVDAKGKAVYRPMSTAAQKEVFASGKVPDGYDFVVLTYSQVNTGDAISVAEQIEAAKKNGARVSKKKLENMRPTPKATFLRAIAEDNYLLLDESHTAAGSGNTGGYLQSIMRKAKGATFASATFAKRPDTMPLYAIRTAMSKANVEPEKLIAIIERGGVTLQEIMSRALTNAGQMVRRERDMGDVVTDWKTVDDEETVRRARENYDKTIAAFNAIIQFQNTFVKPKVEEIDTDISIMAGSSDIKQGTDQMGVSNVPFASKTYNYTKQLMLALKVNAIVDEVDEQIKSGKHPVIALESTMESSLNDYAINEEIEEPTFSASLLRGLRTVMQYTIKDADGNEVHYTFSPSELGPAAEKAYEELENFIRESTRGIFISPLDAIIDKLHEKGYKVGELTGRNVYVEQTSDGKSFVRRRTDKDKKRMQREFNDGTLDVLILNKSASTGISLHASSKFTDQRQRCMVIAQPLSDINDYMQMIGRTDRTGQVSRCYYVNLGLPVPAESRFLMMLSGKLKSLNANTTTSQDSESNEVQAPDLLNKYGSQVVVEYLRDNPEIYEKMGEPLRANNERVSVSKLDEYEPQEGDARKITGYVALLTTKEQEDFYIDVVGRYNSLIQYLNDIGANDLHITVMPLRAKTLEKKVSSEGVDPNGENPFAQNAYLEKVEMDVLRKPMKSEEVHKLIEQVNNGQDGNSHREHIMEIVRSENDKKRETEEERYQRDLAKRDEDLEKQIAKINASTKRTEEEKREAIERLKNDTLAAVEERHTRNTVRIDDAVTSMDQELSRMKVGDTFLIPDVLDSMIFSTSSPAIFCGYKAKESKITPSTTFAVFAVLDGRRKIEVKLSEYNVLRQIERVTDENYDAAHQTTLDNWDSSIPTGTRKEGYILTGNIIQAVSDSQNDRGGFTGQLISFTDEEGNVRDGILMPDNWNAGMLRNSGVPINARAADLKRGVDLKSTDGKVKVEKNYGYFSLSVPKTKKEGGKYFENEELLSLVSGNNFYPYRGQLRGDIAVEDIDDVLTILSNLGVRVEKAEDEGDARFREGNGKIEAIPDLGYTKKQAERYREREQKRMRGHVAEMAEKMHMTDKVVVHDTAEGLKGRYATAKGWYDNKTGKIHVVIDNNRNIFDVMMTMMHEGVAHYGLRKMCGEHFDAFLDDVFANADESIKSAIRDKMDSMRNKDKNKKSEEAYRRAATEEYMADVAEQMEFSDAPPATFKSWWSKIKDLFLEMWGKLGLGKYFGPTISDNEIRYILWRSWQNMVNPGKYRNPFAVEEERARAEERMEPKVEAKVETPKEDTKENVLVAADNTKVVGSNQGAKGFISTTQGDDYTFEQKTKMLDTYRMIKENYNAIALLNTPTGYVLINDGAKAARKVFGLDNSPYVVVDKEGLDEVLPRMIRAGYRLAIADVMTDDKVSEDDVDVLFRDGEESGDIFVSNALRAVDGIKQEKATPEQWLKMIEKVGGLKAGEDKWMGLSEWLKGSDKKTLTKQEVQDFIRQNQIQVEEVVYEKPNKDYTIKLQRLQDEFNAIMSEMTENFYVLTKELDTFELDMESKYGNEWMIELSKEEGERFSNLVTRREEARQKTEEASKKAFEEMVSRYGDDFRKAFNVRESILSPKVNSNGEMLPVAKKLLGVKENINSVRLSYTTKGLDNKREIALVVPTIEPWNENDEVHFGDAGEGRSVAWVRFGETFDSDGNKVLVIDEIQSKRHQEGREKGYQSKTKKENLNFVKAASGSFWLITDKNDPHFFDREPVLSRNETADDANLRYSSSKGIPDAPFDKNWHELAMKRMLRYAAENGYDKIAWTTGEQQAARYNIGNVVSSIDVTPYEAQSPSESNGHDLVMTLNDGTMHEMFVQPDGTLNANSEMFDGKKASEVFGKGIAEKIMSAEEPTEISGDGLRIGAEGMAGFYDQMLPRFMDKYGKKWGVKTGKIELPDLEEAGQTMWAVDVTPEMKASVMQGQTMFRVREDAPPKKTGIGYKVFYLKDGKLYPPMVANPNGEATPVGTWLDADAAPVVGETKTGRQQVKVGGKGTQKSSGGTLSYRPGWHLGQIPYAVQFNRGEKVDNPLGVTNKKGEVIKVGKYFPKDFVWGEVEYADDVDYQDEAMSYGYNEAGNFQHSLAGLPRLPKDGSYTYRTNANPATDPWIITGAMKVNRILTPSEVDDMVRKAGREPQLREEGAITDEQIDALNKQIATDNQDQTDQKRTTAEQLAGKLGVKVNIVDDVKSITHGNARQQERRRNAKGWYNTATGEVTIVLPNNRNVDDVIATTLHEVVAHKGLREMVGEERYNDFLDEIYSHLNKELKEKVDKDAFNMFTKGLGKSKDTMKEHRRVAVDELLGKLAEKGFDDFTEGEKSIWQKLKETVLKVLNKFLDTLKLPKWFTLGDNELRYILWRSKERMERGKENPIDMAKDNIKRRELGLDDSEGSDLFRDSDHDVADDMGIAGGHYERMMRNSLFQAQEAMQDSMLSLKVLQEGIEKETGKPILDFENAYLAENALSSTNKAELDLYNRMLMQPLIDEIAAIAKKLYPGRKGRRRRKEAINEISLYTIAKHGLERNEVFARRDADRAASNLYDDAIDKAQRAVVADPLDQDAIDTLDALKQQKQDYSDQEYEKNRERDYSGLTSLFATTDVADAEAKAQKAVDDFENAIGAEHTTDLWNCINNATQAILVKQKECGLLSNAQYQRASTMFQNYVPLRGFDDTVAEDVYEYFGGDFRVSGPVIRKAAGRTSLADNVFANIQSMADHGFMQANRNAMKQRFLMMAEGHKTDLVSVGQLWMAKNATTGEWELIYPELAADTLFKDAENAIENFDDLMADLVKKDPDNYKKVADNPNIPYKVLSDRNKAMHSVVVKRGGKSRIVTINGNPRAALALNGMTNPNGDNKGFIQKSLGKINWVNRHLSQLYTTWNPDFVASNFCRDIIYSHAMTLVREDAAYNARFTWNHLKNANPITMARLIRKYEKGTLDDADDLERNFLDFMKYGGETGYKSSREDLDEYKRSIESELKKANSGTRQFFSALLHLLENANRSVENSARFAAYLTSREVGRSTMRAIKDAKEITVNFNKKGAGDAFLDTKGQTKLGNAAAMMSGAGRGLYVFWNAGVQGLTNALNTIKNKETRGKAIAMLSSIFALGVGNVIYQILAGGDDDDESNGYFDLPSYTRRSAFCMKKPGTKTWMTPPLPPEFKAIYGLGELAASVLAGKEHYEGSELALAVGNQIGQMLPLNPWESGSGVWWAPSAVKPALEANMNIKWTGQPVQKETPYNTYAPEWTKAFSSADRNIVAATKWLNELGGGDEYKKADQEWLFDWSPAKIEYVLQGMMGGAYTFPSKLVKFGETVAGKRDFEWRNMPIANRFLTSGNDMTKKRAIDNEYFKYVDRLKSFQFRINGYNKDTKGSDEDKAKVSEKKLEELRKTEEFQKFAIFNDIKKRIDKLNKGYKATGSDELADSIMTLRKKANEVMRRSGEDLKHYIEVTFPREE